VSTRAAETPGACQMRPAVAADIPRLLELIHLSVRGLSAGYYSARQIESGLRYFFGARWFGG
jgi:hypothetical protein